ncbi:MAG: BirA family transcriptional regulator [Pelagibacterales bacterium]|nr:BirA family transcriptional regulator [Pelagibacterales bacterium]
MKFNIFKFKKVTSTNDEAIRLIKKKRKTGYVFAENQTKGRGTYGKKWISLEGNLFGTFFFQLKKNYPPFNEFSIINPVIISDVIQFYCKKENISIKFPNDIFVNKKKICGILQEHLTLNKKEYLIIGIGINIISHPVIYEEYKATNFFLETKKKTRVEEVADLLILRYEKFFNDLSSYDYLSFKKKANLIKSA